MKEKCIGSTRLYDGYIIKVRVDDVEMENGMAEQREIVSHPGGAAILAVKDGKVLLERQFRYAYDEEIVEIPAGKRDRGEDFYDTAIRELEEETGLIPQNLELICKMYPSPGYTDEIIGIFYADKFISGNIHFDDNEFLTSEWVDMNEAMKMITDGKIKDAKTIIALLWYANRDKNGKS